MKKKIYIVEIESVFYDYLPSNTGLEILIYNGIKKEMEEQGYEMPHIDDFNINCYGVMK